mgnify:CR=1 FL=1
MTATLRFVGSPRERSASRRDIEKSRGFTMVELLVAILILAIGLLGVAGVQLRSLQQNATAAQGTQVNIYAQDVLERIRLNNDAAIGSSELDPIQDRFRQAIGDPNATITQSISGSTATITLSWTARDALVPAGENQAAGYAAQMFTFQATM